MGLAESLSRIAPPVQSLCTLGKILKALPESENKALTEALDSAMLAPEIYKALRLNGYRISSGTIRDHRKKKCPCYWEAK